METKQTIETNDCPSGLYSDLTQENLTQVRQEKLLVFLNAKRELDEVDTEIRLRQWRTGLIERGIDRQKQLEVQRLEAKAIGIFKKDNEGQVMGAPRGSFGTKRNQTRKTSILSDTNEAAVLEMLASLG